MLRFLSPAMVATALVVACPALAAPPVAAQTPQALIAGQIPGVSPEQVTPSPIPGVYEVRLGSKIVYVSADARFLLQGEIINLATSENITEARRDNLRRAVIATVDESSMVIFAPARYTDTITVFTDIDCGYCQKLHRQIADYNARGIRVRYMAFPRSGPGTASWKDAERVWCSADRRSALTKAKLGEKLTAPDCKASAAVAQHFEIGRDFGLQGTPAIVLESGELIGGYLEPAELAKYLAESRVVPKVGMR
jgi:thiol:disulfide interchange protein DsbC